MKSEQEKLLWAWMQMSFGIRGNRILTGMSMNEIMVCSILYRAQKKDGAMLTLTDLCEATHMYKSQINRILTDLEKQELIERIPSPEDKRKALIHLVEEHQDIYFQEHDQVMQLVSAVTEKMGSEKIRMLTALMEEATEIVDQYQNKKE